MVISFLFLYNHRSDFILSDELKSDIDQLSQVANKLPDDAYRLFELEYLNGLSNTPNSYYLKQLLGDTQQSCACENLARLMSHNSIGLDYGLNKLIIANYLFDNYGNKKCLDIYLHRFDFVNNQVGIIDAADFYFNKNLSALNKSELATLVVMLRNPSLYNPIRNPDKVNEKAKLLIEKIKN